MRKTIVSLLPVYLATFTFVALLCVGIAVASAPRVPRKQLPSPDPTAEGVWYANVNRLLDTAHWNEVAAWNYNVAAWQYTAARNAAAAAAPVVVAPVPTGRALAKPSSGGTPVPTGGCGDLPAYIVQRESGGNPNAVNPSSGTFGCAQLQPSHFAAGGACAGLDYTSCVNKLWAGGAGSSNWAATR